MGWDAPAAARVADEVSDVEALSATNTGQTPEEMMSEFLETHGYVGDPTDWRGVDPGDDDDGNEDEDFDTVYERMFGGESVSSTDPKV
jgi:hypothetical protein